MQSFVKWRGKSGVYRITCVNTDKIYIGSSNELDKRLRGHRSSLRAGKHRNPYLQRAWDKHGEEAFVFEIIERVEVVDLLPHEQEWMDLTLCYEPELGFNISRFASSTTGVKKIGESCLSKRWVVTAPDGREEVVISLRRFCRNRGLSISNLHKVAYGDYRQSEGWKCRPAELSIEQWKKLSRGQKPLRKNWKLVDPDGVVYETADLQKFCVDRGMKRKFLYRVANGQRKHYKGWRCSRVSE
jgi:hypothetical protein